MKAIIYHQFGGVEVLKYEDVPKPEVGDNEVLVSVKAASLNQLDLRLRSGKSPRPVDLPHIGGVDVAGDVAEVGKSVADVKVGTRVVIDPTVRTGETVKVVGVNLHGGLADYVKIPAANVVPIPDNLSYDLACTLPICYVTAWYGLFDRGNLNPGETVLVHAAGSGTGSAAIEVAKLSGAYVIATAGTDAKLTKAKDLGADEVINYNTSDFAEEVKKITNKRGVDIIFDQIGGSVWDKNLQSLASQGRLLLVGVVGGGTASANLGPIIMRDLSIVGVTVFNSPRRDLETVVKLTGQGRLRPVIDKKFPLKEAADAQKLLEDRNQFGKVILNP